MGRPPRPGRMEDSGQIRKDEQMGEGSGGGRRGAGVGSKDFGLRGSQRLGAHQPSSGVRCPQARAFRPLWTVGQACLGEAPGRVGAGE